MTDFYKGLYEQQKESWEELLVKYSEALAKGYQFESDFKSLDASVRGMFRYHVENYIKQKQIDESGLYCLLHRQTAVTLGIILGYDSDRLNEELDGAKKAVLDENDNEKSIG